MSLRAHTCVQTLDMCLVCDLSFYKWSSAAGREFIISTIECTEGTRIAKELSVMRANIYDSRTLRVPDDRGCWHRRFVAVEVANSNRRLFSREVCGMLGAVCTDLSINRPSPERDPDLIQV
jgi:hypothetical protein